ncbi:DUF4238 domain-containing protein [Nostocoides sp. HKS02]|uniref:DUF4238 domain-containing protein n=1 Tax=Nostocoides sp. HKS02 TaxID=1813880 RepID=UPI0012B4AFF2|nr:DUF4238 domain-containing protein [Tetrasphaera sp. HKS02]QGN58982.1 DUF4238 domain-containing protein [Tetrasphaera sp. HKS02]
MTGGGRALSPAAEEYFDRLLTEAGRADSPSRRHHYVPRTYLRQWAYDERRIWALNTSTGIAKPLGISDVCVKENFHRVVGPDGPHNRVELMFGVVDSELRRVQSVLLRLSDPDDLSFDDYMALGVTMAVQRMRTLQQRRLHQQQAAWLEAQNPNDFQRLQDTPNNPHLVAGFHTETLFRAMWEAADVLTGRQLEIWDDSQGRIVTSDVPVVVPFRAGARPNLLAAPQIFWPISPDRVVVLSNEDRGEKAVFRRVTAAMAAALRGHVIQGREQMIFAGESQLRYLPVGKTLPRRAQARLRCSQWSPQGEYVPPPGCVVEWTDGYGATPDVQLCDQGWHRNAPGMLDYI